MAVKSMAGSLMFISQGLIRASNVTCCTDMACRISDCDFRSVRPVSALRRFARRSRILLDDVSASASNIRIKIGPVNQRSSQEPHLQFSDWTAKPPTRGPRALEYTISQNTPQWCTLCFFGNSTTKRDLLDPLED